MRVKPGQIAIGAALFTGLCVGPALLALRWGNEDLSIEFTAAPPLTIAPGEPVSCGLKSRKTLRLSIDGQPQPVAEGKVEIQTEGLAPGLHVARFLTTSDASTAGGKPLWDRTIALGFLQGPFEEVGTWQTDAARLHLGQALLDGFVARVASEKLPGLFAGQPDLPPVKSAAAVLKWVSDGLDTAIHLQLATGTELVVSTHAHLWVDESHDLRIQRVGDVQVTGSQMEIWRKEGPVTEGARRGARLGGAIIGRLGELLGAGLGGLFGKAAAEMNPGLVDQKIQQVFTTAVDEKGAQFIEELLRLPPPFEVKNGIKVRLRYSAGLKIEPGHEASIGFDVQVALGGKPAATTPGPVRRASVEPPLNMATHALGLDVSPALIDGFLDGWWRSGALTSLMNESRWLDLANKGPYSADLDVQLQRLDPKLPPSLEMVHGEPLLRVAETEMTLLSAKGKTRDARAFADVSIVPRYAEATKELSLDVQVAELAVTCHDADAATGKVQLRPCYPDLLKMMKEKVLELPDSNVTKTLAVPLNQLLFKGGAEGIPLALRHLAHLTPSVVDSQGSPWLRVTADAVP